MLLAEIACRGCDDGSFTDDDLAPLTDRLADVVLAYELRRFFMLRHYRGSTWDRAWD